MCPTALFVVRWPYSLFMTEYRGGYKYKLTAVRPAPSAVVASDVLRFRIMRFMVLLFLISKVFFLFLLLFLQRA